MSARLRKGDTVQVISGSDKGKTGTIVRVLEDEGKVVVQGIHVVKRHMKPSPRAEKGGIVEKELPIFASKVMLLDPKTNKPTRVRFEVKEGKKVRVATKSGETVAYPKAGK